MTMSESLESLKSQKGFKIIHVNSRSVIQHFDELYTTFLDGSLDIVVFTESWLHSNCANSLINVPGYMLHRLDRQTKTINGTTKRGGGILVYVKEGISVTGRTTLDISNSEVEIMSLTCKQGMHRNVNLTVVYRPPMGNVQSAIDSIESVV